MQVRRPTAAEKEKTQWSRGQVFVEYFGTEQIQALSTLDVKRWREKSGPRKPRADLKGAVEQASRAVSRGARV